MSEVLEMVRELGALGRVDRPSATVLARAYGLMARLRGCGFSSSDVSLLSARRWDSSLVRKRGKWLGDVDVTGRDELLGLIGKFAAEGGTVEELANYREAKRRLEGIGFSFDGVVRLFKNLLACRSSVMSIDELSLKLARTGRGAEEVSQRIDVDEKLEAMGLTREVQRKLLASVKLYGGADEVLDAVIADDGMKKLHAASRVLEGEVAGLKSEIVGLQERKKALQEEIDKDKIMVNAVNVAKQAGFNEISLTMVGFEADKYGGPEVVLKAIAEYPSLIGIDTALASKGAELKGVSKELEINRVEIGNAELNIKGLNIAVAEAKQVYDENQNVKLVVDLLVDPREMGQYELITAGLVALVLEKGSKRIEKQLGPPFDPEKLNYIDCWLQLSSEFEDLAARIREQPDFKNYYSKDQSNH